MELSLLSLLIFWCINKVSTGGYFFMTSLESQKLAM